MSEPTAKESKLIHPLLGAIMNDRLDGPNGVRELSKNKSLLNKRNPAPNETNYTPLIRAASQGSWQMVEILLKAGADPWAYDEFGHIVARFAFNDQIYPLVKEVPYRENVRKILLKIGYTRHPPVRREVLKLAQEGKWPPEGVRLTAEGVSGDE
ncbi:ankyrin repeat domain-containing protein [Acetobacteraceae bacterium]|nr:ankyrin repeat domain-containing protein [Acetobacteraceae bacterium]